VQFSTDISEDFCDDFIDSYLCILFYFELYVTMFIYPASAAKHNKRMCVYNKMMMMYKCNSVTKK